MLSRVLGRSGVRKKSSDFSAYWAHFPVRKNHRIPSSAVTIAPVPGGRRDADRSSIVSNDDGKHGVELAPTENRSQKQTKRFCDGNQGRNAVNKESNGEKEFVMSFCRANLFRDGIVDAMLFVPRLFWDVS
uniref:Uncharacterized protein n=1 Tax=Steinernema glaseri TaxID=37863 RepID=A0A1I7ZC49_9BILA